MVSAMVNLSNSLTLSEKTDRQLSQHQQKSISHHKSSLSLSTISFGQCFASSTTTLQWTFAIWNKEVIARIKDSVMIFVFMVFENFCRRWFPISECERERLLVPQSSQHFHSLFFFGGEKPFVQIGLILISKFVWWWSWNMQLFNNSWMYTVTKCLHLFQSGILFFKILLFASYYHWAYIKCGEI